MNSMSTFLQPQFVILFYVLLRAADIAIGASIARDVIRAVLYGIIAIFAIVIVVSALFGLH